MPSQISIHALLAESDACTMTTTICTVSFLSTLSLRRATLHCKTLKTFRHYFYPRSPCGERRYLINTYHRIFGISIHALLAESDRRRTCQLNEKKAFLSTLSLRRATLGQFQRVLLVGYFYPRSPCGERPSAKSTPEEA